MAASGPKRPFGFSCNTQHIGSTELKNSWQKWIELVAVVGVVSSLLLVAYQVQQANRIAIATVQYELSAQQNEFLRLVFENEEIASFVARFGNDEKIELTETDIARINAWVMHRLNILSSVDLAYENGQVTEDNYRSYVAGYKSLLLRYPQLAAFHQQSIERIDPMGKKHIFKLFMDRTEE